MKDAIVILSKCGKCSNPFPEGDDKLQDRFTVYYKNMALHASSWKGIRELERKF